jgi:predicted nucleic acid-binding protein
VILVDTSVWIDHFRTPSDELVNLLEGGAALIHTFVMGELACGNLHNRVAILNDLPELPEPSLQIPRTSLRSSMDGNSTAAVSDGSTRICSRRR